jgi:acetyltransferase
VLNAARRMHTALRPDPVPYWDGGRSIRPVRPADAEALQDFVRRLSDHSRYLRFFRPLRELPPGLLKRLIEADGATEQVLVAVSGEAIGARIVGLAQTALEDDHSGEFALVIADDWQGRGLGRRLMGALLGAAQAAGAERIWGDVMIENRAMLGLARSLGFSVSRSPLDATARRVRRTLEGSLRRVPPSAERDVALSA